MQLIKVLTVEPGQEMKVCLPILDQDGYQSESQVTEGTDVETTLKK